MSGLLDELNRQQEQVERIKALKDFFSKKNIEQKTNVTTEQVRIIASARAKAGYTVTKFIIKRNIVATFCDQFLNLAVSSPPSKHNGRDMAERVLSATVVEEKKKIGLLGKEE